MSDSTGPSTSRRPTAASDSPNPPDFHPPIQRPVAGVAAPDLVDRLRSGFGATPLDREAADEIEGLRQRIFFLEGAVLAATGRVPPFGLMTEDESRLQRDLDADQEGDER